jgi:hypothetical protein
MEHEVECHESPIGILLVVVVILEEKAEYDDENEDEGSFFVSRGTVSRHGRPKWIWIWISVRHSLGSGNPVLG